MMEVWHYSDLTDEECYQNLKKMRGNCFMSAEEWRKQRLKVLESEGKIWSK